MQKRMGLVEFAHGGTLILDELLNLPLHAQKLLLDFAQFGTYRPLGYAKAAPKAVAEDAAGNRREVSFHTVVKPRTFADKTLEVDDAFLERKGPEIPTASGLPAQPDLGHTCLVAEHD